MKSLFILFFIGCTFLSFSQEINKTYINSIKLEYNFLGNVSRSVTLPSSVRNNGFYQFYFGNYGVPERIISRKYLSQQIGVKIGLRFDSYSKKNNHELILGIGYQNSGDYTDRLIRNNYPKDSSNFDKDLARIEIEQKFREVYLNGAWLFKTNGKYFSIHTGLGLNISLSNPNYNVTEFENELLINQYSVKNGIKTNYNFYIPMGFELKGKSVIFGFDYSVRYDDHFFSGASFSIGYKY